MKYIQFYIGMQLKNAINRKLIQIHGEKSILQDKHAKQFKGQIISEQICGVLKFSKKAKKYCQDFCPSL